jgi:xanthine/CO dehydrogenase XdhC/CoxF family maturation factor
MEIDDKASKRAEPCCEALQRAMFETLIVHEDKQWNVPGCCGGGCNVLFDLKFCPFCGSRLLP